MVLVAKSGCVSHKLNSDTTIFMSISSVCPCDGLVIDIITLLIVNVTKEGGGGGGGGDVMVVSTHTYNYGRLSSLYPQLCCLLFVCKAHICSAPPPLNSPPPPLRTLTHPSLSGSS